MHENAATTRIGGGVRFLIAMAAFVVVVAGLKAAAEIVIPVLVAVFLALLCAPVLARLRRTGLPGWVRIAIVIVGLALVLVLAAGLVTGSVRSFSDAMPRYEARLGEIERDVFATLEGWGVSKEQLEGGLRSGTLLNLVSKTMKGLLGALSSLVVVLLITIFLLAEAGDLPAKLRRAKGDDDLTSWQRASDAVLDYMKIKAGVSLITGAAVAVFLAILGVDFPVLWGVVAFLFNFIPNIGSIIAAVPAVVLALIQFGTGTAVAVGVGFVAINMVVGNVLEPRWMGRKLGLSPVVVLLSLIFWNWVLGPVGMLLSVPLTTVVQIAMEQSSDGRVLAVMLGTEKGPDAAVRA